MTLQEAAHQLRANAENNDPFDPFGRTGLMPQQNRIDLVVADVPDNWSIRLQFTKTKLSKDKLIWQLSIGKNPDGKIDSVPEAIIQHIKSIVLPKGEEMPSVLGNSRQFWELIK